MRKAICVALLVWGCFWLAAPACAQGVSAIFKRVKDSVVVVKVTDEHRSCPSEADDEYDGIGSGVLIDPRGKVLTAAHVVEDAKAISVEFADGETIAGRVAATSPGADVALIELAHPPRQPVVAPLADSDKVEVGDQVFVVGAPLGISTTLTVGYVSGLRDDDVAIHGIEPARYLQTDAAINPGNSGGPMFNLAGQVVGIVSYIISRSGGHEGLGFAVTSNTAKTLLFNGSTLWTGLEGILLDGDLAAALNVPQGTGILVQRVVSGSHVASLGLKQGVLESEVDGEPMRLGGDVILAFDGIPLSKESIPEWRDHLRGLKAGQRYEVSVLRGGKVITLSTTVPR